MLVPDAAHREADMAERLVSALQRDDDPARPPNKFAIWFSFVLVGPFVGWLVAVPVWIAMAAKDAKDLLSFTDKLLAIAIAMVPFGLPFAYVFGLLPAVMAGAFLVALESRFRTPSVVVAFAVGLAVGGAGAWYLYLNNPAAGGNLFWVLAVFAASTISTPVSWYIVRLRKRPQS
jgi:hypothetical protein